MNDISAATEPAQLQPPSLKRAKLDPVSDSAPAPTPELRLVDLPTDIFKLLWAQLLADDRSALITTCSAIHSLVKEPGTGIWESLYRKYPRFEAWAPGPRLHDETWAFWEACTLQFACWCISSLDPYLRYKTGEFSIGYLEKAGRRPSRKAIAPLDHVFSVPSVQLLDFLTETMVTEEFKPVAEAFRANHAVRSAKPVLMDPLWLDKAAQDNYGPSDSLDGDVIEVIDIGATKILEVDIDGCLDIACVYLQTVADISYERPQGHKPFVFVNAPSVSEMFDEEEEEEEEEDSELESCSWGGECEEFEMAGTNAMKWLKRISMLRAARARGQSLSFIERDAVDAEIALLVWSTVGAAGYMDAAKKAAEEKPEEATILSRRAVYSTVDEDPDCYAQSGSSFKAWHFGHSGEMGEYAPIFFQGTSQGFQEASKLTLLLNFLQRNVSFKVARAAEDLACRHPRVGPIWERVHAYVEQTSAAVEARAAGQIAPLSEEWEFLERWGNFDPPNFACGTIPECPLAMRIPWLNISAANPLGTGHNMCVILLDVPHIISWWVPECTGPGSLWRDHLPVYDGEFQKRSSQALCDYANELVAVPKAVTIARRFNTDAPLSLPRDRASRTLLFLAVLRNYDERVCYIQSEYPVFRFQLLKEHWYPIDFTHLKMIPMCAAIQRVLITEFDFRSALAVSSYFLAGVIKALDNPSWSPWTPMRFAELMAEGATLI